MKKLTFLLVDDDQDDVLQFQETLESISDNVGLQIAVNGQQALTMLRAADHVPDIIFLDLNMPIMDGKQCLAELKNDPRLRDIPVIMYTTSSYAKDIEVTIQMGALCFITKPSNLKELRIILSDIVVSASSNLKKALRELSDKSSSFIVC